MASHERRKAYLQDVYYLVLVVGALTFASLAHHQRDNFFVQWDESKGLTSEIVTKLSYTTIFKKQRHVDMWDATLYVMMAGCSMLALDAIFRMVCTYGRMRKLSSTVASNKRITLSMCVIRWLAFVCVAYAVTSTLQFAVPLWRHNGKTFSTNLTLTLSWGVIHAVFSAMTALVAINFILTSGLLASGYPRAAEGSSSSKATFGTRVSVLRN